MTQVISLPVFPSRANLKLHNISVTPKMVRKVVMNPDLSKGSGPDCIPVVVQKNCEPELSYILAELFNKCLKEILMGFFLISSMVSGLLDQLLIFSQLYLIELPGLLTGLGLLEL